MKALILGDPHLGKGTKNGRPGIGNALNSRVQDQVKLLEFTIQTAIDNDVFNIIITGDVFEDAKAHPNIIGIFIDWLHQCTSNGIDVHVIMGNHDILRTGSIIESVLDLIAKAQIPNVHIYKDIDTIHYDGFSITLLPYRDRSIMGVSTHVEAISIINSLVTYEQAMIPDDNLKIVVGHLALEGSIHIGDEFDDVASEIYCPLSMFSGYDYVWMGHVHKKQVMQKKPLLAHIGSMDVSDFGESNEKKYIIIIDPKDPNKFKEIQLPCRQLRKISLTVPRGDNATEYLIQAIKEENDIKSIKDAIVRLEVKLCGHEAEHSDHGKVESYVYSLGAQHICSFTEQRTAVIVPLSDQNAVDSTMDVDTALKTYAEQVKFIDDAFKVEFLKEASEVMASYEYKKQGDG
jgi:DNA repair protein SbcD/Mre11